MATMDIAVKKLHHLATIPTYGHETDACFDFYALGHGERISNKNGNKLVYKTGIAIEIPKDYVGLVFQRSSVCKKALSLSNAVGVIDHGYVGDITFIFNVISQDGNFYGPGDRIGQMMIIPRPKINLIEVDEFSSELQRGGFGSTGE